MDDHVRELVALGKEHFQRGDYSLAAGHLGGLALDVFDPEPPSRQWPDDPRLILTPHIGGGTYEARASIGVRSAMTFTASRFITRCVG